MEVYYFIIVSAFFLCFFDFVNLKGIKLLVYILFCTFLTLIPAFRMVGIDNDSVSYQQMYRFYSSSSMESILRGGFGYVEKGYVLLNYFLAKMGFTYNGFLILFASLISIVNYSFFYRYSRFAFLSLLFYVAFFYFYRDFTQIRYALSGAFVFWFVVYYYNNKYYKALLFFLLAFSFHNAAFIMIPVILFVKYVNKRSIYLLMPIPAFILGLGVNILSIFLNLNVGSDHMSIYKNDHSGGSLSISIIGYFFILLYSLVNKSTLKKEDSSFEFWLWKIVAMSVALNILIYNVSIFQRFSFLLFQFSILLLPVILSDLHAKLKRKEGFLLVYFLFCLLLLLYGFRIINESLVRPYVMF